MFGMIFRCCLLLVALVLGPVSKGQSQEKLSELLSKESLEKLADEATRFGDPVRGALAFYNPTMNCAKCHELSSTDRRLGPDLSEKRDVAMTHLIQSVLEPSAQIKEGFESAVVQLEDGRMITGVLVDQDEERIVIDLIDRPDEPLSIAMDSVDDWKRTKVSSMPVELVNQLSDRGQFLDLVAYLGEIAKGGPLRAAELRPASAMALTPLPEYESRVDHAGLISSLDEGSIERGAETFRLRCASCHGTLDEEGSMPTSLRFAEGKFKNGNDPYQMYQTLTHGYGMMNAQRWMVPQQKYEVIHYIREHFIESRNEEQYFEITSDYLGKLPKGDTRGPKPIVSRPWTLMDYGSSLINTIEVSDDQSNIAQKGIAVRLDDGPGGVESGSHWLMYEHDTMRVAGAWTGRFIDWEGIHFNGTHGRHPKVAGSVHFASQTGPGVARPTDGSTDLAERFSDDRVVGRDGKHYGPLDASWAKYLGMYRFGKRTILKYRVGESEIHETPGLAFVGENPVYTRTLNVGRRDQDIILKLAETDLNRVASESGMMFLPAVREDSETKVGKTDGIKLTGDNFAEIADGDSFDMTESDYTIFARIKTKSDGTIFAQTKNQDQWIPQGKTFFIRGGRLALDIGWVGAVQSNRKVNDGKWHDVAISWQKETGRVRFYVDGKPAGRGELAPEKKIKDQVARIGFTNNNFPEKPYFRGTIGEVRFYQRALSAAELAASDEIRSTNLVGTWRTQVGSEVPEAGGNKELTGNVSGASGVAERKLGLMVDSSLSTAQWNFENGMVLLTIPRGDPVQFVISHSPVETMEDAKRVAQKLADIQRPMDLAAFQKGGPPSYPERLTTRIIRGQDDGPFAVDVFERPRKNPWNAQLRLTGIDFLADGNTMIATAWDGSVWRVSGFGKEDSNTLQWQRIAAGLFQPLGVKFLNDKIYVTCRDQIVILHDLNGDYEIDWYENFNSDHQVTEHFHEFAMGLQADEEGNLYYAKSARHAKVAVVPHHGTLLKVTPDGSKTEILANGFRAANGVCLNPDGSFVVTDQEGHWNPKNRINWVKPGGFYGNMFGYHDVTDDSDDAMDSPLCWITNEFDRSPSELMWVDSDKWGALNGSLLNFSYGYGKVYVVPHEKVDGQMQGGMCEFPIAQFPTGVMRGRFHSGDGHLYCCGMFAWAGSQQQPGGLYRIRRTENPVHLPIGLKAIPSGVQIKFSDQVEKEAALDTANWKIQVWDLKRTRNYGSKHYNQVELEVSEVELQDDCATVNLTIPDLKPTWGMEILYSIKTEEGGRLQGRIHNTIHKMPKK